MIFVPIILCTPCPIGCCLRQHRGEHFGKCMGRGRRRFRRSQCATHAARKGPEIAGARAETVGGHAPGTTGAIVDPPTARGAHCAATDVILGPASDGGYWLIGLRAVQPGLFENVPWSTASVLETTLTRVRNAGLTFYCLRQLTDIDTAADWQEFKRATQRSP